MCELVRKYMVGKVKIIVVFTLITLLSTVMSVVLTFYSGIFIDVISNKTTEKNVLDYIAFLFVLNILSIMINYIYKYIDKRVKTELSFSMKKDIIEHLYHISIVEYKKYNPTYLNQRLNVDIDKIWTFFLSYYINIFIQMFSIISLLIILFRISANVFYVSIILVAFYTLSYLGTKNVLYKYGLENKEEAAQYFRILNEQFELMEEIKANALYSSSLKKITQGFKKYYSKVMKYSNILFIVQSLDMFISSGAKLCILLIGGLEIVKGNMTLGSYVVINSYFSMLFQCVKFYFSIGQDYQDAKNSYARIDELLSIPRESNGKKYIEKIDAIQLQDINFKYKNQNDLVINHFNYSFFKKNIYFIEGDNGKGKSTLIQIVLGMLEVNKKGSVKYNNINIKELNLSKIRYLKISTYIQNAKTIDGSVIEVMQYWTNLEKSEIIRKMKDKMLFELFFFEGKKICSIFHKRINLLSGGERQKIILLCILLVDSDVLILDEPVSNLDRTSIVRLCKYLEKQREDHIIIIVSHNSKMVEDISKAIQLTI